ncbi:unnamed protein product [Caenorhabditis angaria]|uniref:HP domain-containing protein n=1 Tax=Caenorhabditis angaria TaxID=860376 RepID=A0A9P1I2L4_9PELO|nr:unnamed protein product [Caenorhabditis angaria]
MLYEYNSVYEDHLMIAQLKKSLQQNGQFEKKNVEKAHAETSLKDRLKLLSDSANLWQQRAPPKRSTKLLTNEPTTIQAKIERPREKSCDISNGLNKFFGPTSSNPSSSTTIAADDIDLDAILVSTAPKLTAPRKARAPNRKSAASSQQDERIRLETVKIDEEKFGEDNEEEPEKLETQAQAIAALKNAKQLLKSPTKKSIFPDVMLVQIKGAKHTDVRIVSPSIHSIHENACFVVITHRSLIKYEGANSNILEKTKASQLCIEIIGKTDLNCVADSFSTIDQVQKSQLLKFLSNTRQPEENNNNNSNFGEVSKESFEVTISAKLNLVFRIADDRTAQTVSRREKVSYSMLQPDETLIFDFGSEIYVWSGRNSTKIDTAYAVEYAKQLLNKKVKNGRNLIGDFEESNGEKRPDWTLFRKLHQGVLDSLFKSKFYDWPDKEIMNTCRPKPLFAPKKPNKFGEYKVKMSEDEEIDGLVQRMIEEQPIEPILILEDQEIDRKMHDVITEDLDLWILGGEILKNIEFSNVFDSTRCYVLRWKYRIQKSGVRRIKTGVEEERETGRSRIAFFYWLGERTTPKQHGLCALRIKDIDKDNSPRIRVVQGNEPALFLALFDGTFLVRCDPSIQKPIQTFVVTGANSSETSLREIDESEPKLRSHAAYIRKTTKNGEISVLCGANCKEAQVKLVLAHAEHLKPSSSFQPKIEIEGDSENHKWINSKGRKHAMKVWRLFENEIEQLNHLAYHPDCSFTFTQIILTDTILIDVGEKLWIWSEEVVTTFALKLADKFWKSRNGEAICVGKGEEPEEFKALFLKWDDFEEEEKTSEPRVLQTLLAERCRSFSIEELRARENLPAGMDLRRLENYLTDEDFLKTFAMNRKQFYEQKDWKQNESRKKVGLF